jgi:light-regulated signal transduction histidine kinase (bacteriophytochrome)
MIMANSLEISAERLEQLERQLNQRTQELRELKKELADFSYSVSHDLRAPLRHISGYGEIIEEDYSSQMDPKCRKYFEGIQESAHKMAAMLDDLLKLSRLGSQEIFLQPVELNELVQGVVQEISRGTGERIVEWKIGQLPRVNCDPVMIKQVFYNLFSNALKFTRTAAHGVIESGVIEKDGAVTFFVRDNGIGFDMKYADKLFTIFQRMHSREFEGSGAGLALAHRIVRRHGGRIWAEAEVGKGATFYFTLDGTQTIEG